MRRLRRQRSRPQIDGNQSLVSITEEDKRKLPDITVTSEQRPNKVEIDSDNIETPPVQRKMFNPPPEKEPCRKFQPSLTNRFTNDRAKTEMKDLCQEILGDGQFDRFSATRRTRRYKRNTDSSSPEDEKKPEAQELVAETQVIRPSTLEIQTSYPVDTSKEIAKPIEETKDEKDLRLKRWQDRLKHQSDDIKTPTKDTKAHPYSKMRRQTSINQEDVQKAIRELKSPTETPTGVWARNSYRRSTPNTRVTSLERNTSPKSTKIKSEHDLNDEGFEETQSLNSESASQGASSSCNMDCESPPPKPSKSPDVPKKITTKDHKVPPRTPIDPKCVKKPLNSLKVERSTSKSSLRSSRSSLNSAASIATVRRVPQPPKPVPKPVQVRPVARMPASRSSSSGSSVSTRPPLRTAAKTSGFMRPTQASKGRTGTVGQPTPLRAGSK